MPDISIKTLIRYAPLEQLTQVDLQSTGYEGGGANYKKYGACNTDGLEEKGWRQCHMRQEERGQPSCCGRLAEPVKYRIEDRID